MLNRSVLIVAALFVWPIGLVCGEGEVHFNRQIRPILSANCYHCHGPDEEHREADLRLDQPEGVRAAFGQTDFQDNEAWQRITSDDDDYRMPPPAAHLELKPEEIAQIKQWIEAGAPFEQHWSFVPPKEPAVPAMKQRESVRNSIDAFILARLEEEGLTPNSDATREALIRRLSLDLTGLPPTLEEIDAFLNDKSPQAYEKVVDRLLASPHFGERLALPWLDAARYADTNGFSIDDHRDMWLWREWVIDAFNRNMPYDQFVVEQLAGDLLPDATNHTRLATGFLRNSMNTHEGGTLPDEYRVIYIADKIDTVSTVFMGLTLRCAQCHDHKYDPFSQRDYYKFYAFFDTAHDPGKGAVNGNTQPTIRMDGLLTDAQTFKTDIEQRIATLQRYKLHPPELIELRAEWETTAKESAGGDLADAINVPVVDRTDQQWQTINAEFAKTNPRWTRHAKTIDREIEVLQRDLKAGRSSVMVMKEQGPRQTYVLTRGQYDAPDKNQPVDAGIPQVFGDESQDEKRTRLDLARWLVSQDHPLTARVSVNRHWQMLFGRGLVASPNDFGSQGVFPSHPELLDWLATQYVKSGWDTKWLIKTVVMSSTYRQSSFASAEKIKRDPQNILLARASRFRLPAEFVRDNALAIAGTLDRRVGGPSVYPEQPHGLWREVSHFGYFPAFTSQAFYPSRGNSLHRRSMYTFWKRTSPPPSLTAFDAPTREVCTVERSRTNTPLQALVLLNDPQYVAAAKELANSQMKLRELTTDKRIARMFRLATSRKPDADEQLILRRRYEAALAKYQSDKVKAAALAGEQSPEYAALTVVASIILNLDEVITRE